MKECDKKKKPRKIIGKINPIIFAIADFALKPIYSIKYRLKIDRSPADDLPTVKSEMGVFVDNRIVVKIFRENGASLFERSFVKNDFSSYLTTDFLYYF